MSVKEYALKLIDRGLSVIPINQKDKTPTLPWKSYQLSQMSRKEAESLSWERMALVGGSVSGNLFCIDIDQKNDPEKKILKEYNALVDKLDSMLLGKLAMQKTENGGFHYVGKCEKKIGNKKLAWLEVKKDDGAITRNVMIETRSEGGYFLCAPSAGYELITGDLSQLQTITPTELDTLTSAAIALTRGIADKEVYQKEFKRSYQNIEKKASWEDFDEKNSPEDVVEMLVKEGWKRTIRTRQRQYFQRPGGENKVGASVNLDNAFSWVFTTSTNLPTEKGLSPSALYTHLYHNGNFSNSANELFNKGYGERKEVAPQTIAGQRVQKEGFEQESDDFISLSNYQKVIRNIHRHGRTPGISIGWEELDKYFTMIMGQMNVLTGVPSSGKSEFMDSILINMIKNLGWEIMIFSPENFPPEEHACNLAEKLLEKRLDNSVSDEEVKGAIDLISSKLSYVNTAKELSVDKIIYLAEQRIKTNDIKMLVIDPWNELESFRPASMTETDYIGLCLMKIRKFSQKHKICTWIVCHPIKQKKDKDGKYPEIGLYDCAGSAHWRNKADNGFVLERDMQSTTVKLKIEKVKRRHYGKPGEVLFEFQPKYGGYKTVNESDAFSFGIQFLEKD